MLTPAQQVDELSILGITFDDKYRQHFAPSHIKILYHLYNFGKGCADVFPETETIAKTLDLHHDTVSRFVNSPEFRKFGFKIRRSFTSNLYRLHDWVIECFRSLEKLGFMKNFRANFDAWRRLWKFRMPKFYLHKLINISTWSQVFNVQLNRTKLSTKHFDGYGTERGHGYGTTRSPSSYEVPMKMKPEFLPCVHETHKVASELSFRFQIEGGDLNWVINSFGLNDIKGGLRIRNQWEKQGMIAESPIKTFVSCLKDYKKSKNGRQFI